MTFIRLNRITYDGLKISGFSPQKIKEKEEKEEKEGKEIRLFVFSQGERKKKEILDNTQLH